MNHPEADTLIENGAGPAELSAFIPDRQEAAVYYARRVGDRFSYERTADVMAKAGQGCVACAHRRATTVAQLRWVASWTKFSFGATNAALLLVGRVSWNEETDSFGFETHHAVCDDCMAAARPNRFVRGLINFATISVAVLGLIAGATGLAGYFYLDHRRGEESVWLAVGIGGVAALIVGVLGQWRFGRTRLPAYFRGVARRPFVFHSAVPVAVAPAPGEQPTNDMLRRAAQPRNLTWQMTLCVLLVVAGLIFAGLEYAHDVDAATRRIGRIGLRSSVAAFVVLLAWHFKGRARRAD